MEPDRHLADRRRAEPRRRVLWLRAPLGLSAGQRWLPRRPADARWLPGLPAYARGLPRLPADARWLPRLPADPRWLQIAFLSLFLFLGLGARDFPAWHAPLVFAAALATQALLGRLTGAPAAGFLSPVITAFGLTLLLRTDEPWLAVLAASCAVASKFVLRVRGRHFFNPANFGLCVAMLASPHAWCSPAQWGESGLFLLWFCALGLMVAHRAFRSDVSVAFLAAFAGLRLARVLLLGQRLAVLEHQLLSGSLLLFAFFMISDPKTTPQTRAGRIALACCVAVLAHALQFVWFVRNPVLWALFACAPLTPLFDAVAGALARPKEKPWNPSPQAVPVLPPPSPLVGLR